MAQEKDPLADLREPDALGDLAGPSPKAEPEPEPVVEIRPMVSQGIWDAMVDEAVAHLHADLTAQGFLHGGAACGCRYIARTALRVVPVMTDADMEERELVPSD